MAQGSLPQAMKYTVAYSQAFPLIPVGLGLLTMKYDCTDGLQNCSSDWDYWVHLSTADDGTGFEIAIIDLLIGRPEDEVANQ